MAKSAFCRVINAALLHQRQRHYCDIFIAELSGIHGGGGLLLLKKNIISLPSISRAWRGIAGAGGGHNNSN